MNTTSSYPLPRPGSGDDPRFTFGLTYDIGKVLAAHGYPPLTDAADFTHFQQALFTAIYQQKDHTS